MIHDNGGIYRRQQYGKNEGYTAYPPEKGGVPGLEGVVVKCLEALAEQTGHGHGKGYAVSEYSRPALDKPCTEDIRTLRDAGRAEELEAALFKKGAYIPRGQHGLCLYAAERTAYSGCQFIRNSVLHVADTYISRRAFTGLCELHDQLGSAQTAAYHGHIRPHRLREALMAAHDIALTGGLLYTPCGVPLHPEAESAGAAVRKEDGKAGVHKVQERGVVLCRGTVGREEHIIFNVPEQSLRIRHGLYTCDRGKYELGKCLGGEHTLTAYKGAVYLSGDEPVYQYIGGTARKLFYAFKGR